MVTSKRKPRYTDKPYCPICFQPLDKIQPKKRRELGRERLNEIFFIAGMYWAIQD